jgi:glycosyltransferase involved in cell wall biosynthesis
MPKGMILRIGFMLPAAFSIGSPGNGIAEQARRQAEALERRGHEVVRLNPWQWQDEQELDVLHFFLGGLGMAGIGQHRQLTKPGLLVFAPIIDSNQSFFSYRFAAHLGNLSARLSTVPGIFRQQAGDSDVVVCRSHHEKERIVRGLGIEPAKVEIVLNGCPLPDTEHPEVQQLRNSLDLPEQFVLHISAFTQERKNVLRLVQAVEHLGYPLVIAGRAVPGAVLDQLRRKAQDRKLLRILGFVDARTKAALYSLCRVFCLPSSHEGTGLAALEAAAYGAALVVTKNGGPPDYFLQHAEYVDPFDLEDIKRAIARAWDKPRDGLFMRYVAENLTWDRSAEALEKLYLKYLALKRRG